MEGSGLLPSGSAKDDSVGIASDASGFQTVSNVTENSSNNMDALAAASNLVQFALPSNVRLAKSLRPFCAPVWLCWAGSSSFSVFNLNFNDSISSCLLVSQVYASAQALPLFWHHLARSSAVCLLSRHPIQSLRAVL